MLANLHVIQHNRFELEFFVFDVKECLMVNLEFGFKIFLHQYGSPNEETQIVAL